MFKMHEMIQKNVRVKVTGVGGFTYLLPGD